MGMSIKEAVNKMGCESKECPYLDISEVKSFCTVLRTDNFCGSVQKKVRKQEIEDFYVLAEKYGFYSPVV